MSCSKSTAPDIPSLMVRRKWGLVKHRGTVRITGISPPVRLESFNNDIDTLERAVKERVFFVKENGLFAQPPRPPNGHFREALSTTFAMLCRHLPSTAPLTRRQFVETFRGRKRKIYEQACASLFVEDFSPRDSEVKVFVKFEKTNFTAKKDPVPRVISPRSPRYNVEIGRFLRPIEERIFKAIAKLFGHKTVFKGMNASAQATLMSEKWRSFKNPVAIGADASRFDQHVSKQALEFEGDVFLSCFYSERHRNRLAQLLKMQHHNRCSGYTPDGSLRYTVEGVRMSGDMNTSLGACVIMCCMIFEYARVKEVKIALANNGDDCVIIMEEGDRAHFSCGFDAWFRMMGFNMVLEEPVHTFEEIEFCQTHPVWVGPGAFDYVMVRDPFNGIAKDTMCLHRWDSPKTFLGWLDAVGQGGISLTGGIPIFQEFYSNLIHNGKTWAKCPVVQSWGVRALGIGMNRKHCQVEERTRASFYWAFGLTPCEQHVIERYYREMRISAAPSRQLYYQTPLPYNN